jgi:hypothetical protein
MEMRGTMRAIITLLLCAGALLAQKTYWMLPPNPVTISSSGTDVFVGTVTVGTGVPFALKNLASYRFCANADSDGASSLNLNSVGAKAIKKVGSTGALADTAATDIKSGVCYVVLYNETADVFQIESQSKPSSGSGHTIRNEGTPLTARTYLNCVGSGISCTDDAGNDETEITVSGSSTGWTVTTAVPGDAVTTQDFFSTKASIPGGTMGVGKMLRVTWEGVATMDTGATTNMTTYLCTDADCASSPTIISVLGFGFSGAGTTNFPWEYVLTAGLAADGTTLRFWPLIRYVAASPTVTSRAAVNDPSLTINPATNYWIGLKITSAISGDTFTNRLFILEVGP